MAILKKKVVISLIVLTLGAVGWWQWSNRYWMPEIPFEEGKYFYPVEDESRSIAVTFDKPASARVTILRPGMYRVNPMCPERPVEKVWNSTTSAQSSGSYQVPLWKMKELERPLFHNSRFLYHKWGTEPDQDVWSFQAYVSFEKTEKNRDSSCRWPTSRDNAANLGVVWIELGSFDELRTEVSTQEIKSVIDNDYVLEYDERYTPVYAETATWKTLTEELVHWQGENWADDLRFFLPCEIPESVIRVRFLVERNALTFLDPIPEGITISLLQHEE